MSSWADEDGDVLPPTETTTEGGVKTIVEYKFNMQRQVVKVTSKFRVQEFKTRKTEGMKQRRLLPKFGEAAGQEHGFIDPACTQTSVEVIRLENPNAEVADNTQDLLDSLAAGTMAISSKWRSAGQMGMTDLGDMGMGEDGPPGSGGDELSSLRRGGPGAAAGKYVPPSMRGGGKGISMTDDRDTATLRVTNISDGTSEQDLRELFARFGHIQRIYLAKDKETFRSRGFAFVTFHSRKEAGRAMESLQGYGYDHLILKIEWAKPSTRDVGAESVMRNATGYGQKLAQDTTEKVSYSSSAKHNAVR
jgi:translation initiation factor 3 subunit G